MGMANIMGRTRLLQIFRIGHHSKPNGQGMSLQCIAGQRFFCSGGCPGLIKRANREQPNVVGFSAVPRPCIRNASSGRLPNQDGFIILHQHSDSGKQVFEKVDDDIDYRSVVVKWTDGQVQDYPYVWLRDNCRCEKCFHPSAFSKLLNFSKIDVSVQPSQVRLSDDRRKVELEWDDGHSSSFNATWLRQYRFDKSPPDLTFDLELEHWDSTVGDRLKEFTIEDILSSDECLYNWIMELKTLGLTLIKAGAIDGEVPRMGERISFLHNTQFGHTTHLKAKPNDASSLAFTNTDFPMHSDLVFNYRPPGILLLHCIEQAKGGGGENWLVDGYKVTEDLRVDDPETFKCLTETEVEFFDTIKGTYGVNQLRARHPTIRLDAKGRPERINVCDHGRDALLRIPTNRVRPFYDALSAFQKKLASPQNLFPIKLGHGDMLVVDNRRVLHGRSGFTMTENNCRHFEGSYLEWEQVDSRLRVLHKDLGYD